MHKHYIILGWSNIRHTYIRQIPNLRKHLTALVYVHIILCNYMCEIYHLHIKINATRMRRLIANIFFVVTLSFRLPISTLNI